MLNVIGSFPDFLQSLEAIGNDTRPTYELQWIYAIYDRSIVTMSISCTVSEIFNVE